jgi:antitoxin component YwqK of YwqJK toxin-antitoxin module
MKPILPCLLFILCAMSVRAQTTRIYLDYNLNPVTDSTKATSRIMLSKYADDTTLWAVSQYTMDNHLLIEGVYKDRDLAVPSGPFKYYYNNGNYHSLHHSGSFFNGVKYGQWIDYFVDGQKMKVVTLRGNVMDGLYEEYSDNDTIPMLKGQYVKGKREGEWTTDTGIDTYKDDKLVRTTTSRKSRQQSALLQRALDSLKNRDHIVNAIQPAEFASYMSGKLSSWFHSHDRLNGTTSILITFTVDETGKLLNGAASGVFDEEFEQRVAKAIEMASPWVPAKSNGKPIKQLVHYTFVETKNINKSSH